MELGVIKQSIFINASPATVYEVVSTPEHLANWYVDDAAFAAVPGSCGHFTFAGPTASGQVPITVLEAVPGVRFSFCWLAPPAPDIPDVGTLMTRENALVVTFDLAQKHEGTMLTVTEEGMRELGWEGAVLQRYYDSHVEGWTTLLDRLVDYVSSAATP